MANYAKRVALIASNKPAFEEISNVMEHQLKLALSLGFINSRWGQGGIVKVNVCSRKYFGINIFDVSTIDMKTMDVSLIEFGEELGNKAPMVGALIETLKGREEH